MNANLTIEQEIDAKIAAHEAKYHAPTPTNFEHTPEMLELLETLRKCGLYPLDGEPQRPS